MEGFETPESDGGVRMHPRPDPGRAGPSVAIRRAHARDLHEIAALFPPALEPYRGSEADWILDAYLAELEDVRPRFEQGEVVIAEREGRIAGTIAFYADVRLEGWSNLPPGWAGFRALAVHPGMRGVGIGGVLIRRCLEQAREVGAETLGIHTIALLKDAVRLYERLGFVRCPEFDLHAADIFPSDRAHDVMALAFRLDLGRARHGAR
jgi:GNAT superfamily N-acetyltransferase